MYNWSIDIIDYSVDKCLLTLESKVSVMTPTLVRDHVYRLPSLSNSFSVSGPYQYLS